MGKDNLGAKSRESLLWDLGGTLIRQLAVVGVSIFLARILGPEEFGVIGMAMVFVSLSQIFIDVGFTEGLIQQKEVSPAAWSSVFYVNIFISLLLGLGIYASAPAIGNFFNNDKVGAVIRYLVLVLPIAAIGKVHSAKLIKSLNFKALSLRDVVSAVGGGIIGIAAALNDQGVYSLVWQQVSTAAFGTILLWVGTGWKPQLVFSSQEINKIFSFSSFVFFDRLLQQLFNKIDTIFIGKFFSPVILGFYSRAESFNALINNYSTKSIAKIAFPLFSALQDDKKRFNAVFLQIISALTILTTTLVGVLFFAADWFIVALLGAKWEPSIAIFQVLIFSTITLPFRAMLFKAMLGKGLSRLKFSIGIFNNIIALASMPIGYFFGLEAFVWSIVGTRLFCTIINWLVLKKRVFGNLQNFLPVIVLPMLNLSIWVGMYFAQILSLPIVVWILLFLVSHFTLLLLSENIGLQVLRREFDKVLTIVRKKVKVFN